MRSWSGRGGGELHWVCVMTGGSKRWESRSPARVHCAQLSTLIGVGGDESLPTGGSGVRWSPSIFTPEMEKHPSFSAVSHLLKKYPNVGGALFQTYNDLSLGNSLCSSVHLLVTDLRRARLCLIDGVGQGWKDVEVLDLQTCSRPALKGVRPGTDASLYVLPCWLSENLTMSLIHRAFEDMGDVQEVYMAITAEDSSIVYYKLSRGLVKPQL
ncbi:hypothetical protein BJ322DRAFT_159039 [Thelephora terrestris]|uniref:tRNA-splicing endonuclease subunit Sen15 domain-containing protein n=1 Tax=Thelephora terrestris TaxID=56493 RepID=A0A9P6HBD0_9AGAM|nr:hypothetical protein BJ322DRAFT_159039 [Thelephora terrestris]